MSRITHPGGDGECDTEKVRERATANRICRNDNLAAKVFSGFGRIILDFSLSLEKSWDLQLALVHVTSDSQRNKHKITKSAKTILFVNF